MPSGPVHRAESLRSENSDTSQNKRVSFNNDVDVKHIPRGAVLDRQGKPVGYSPPKDINLVYGVYKEPPKLSEEEIAREAERIIQQVDQISCTVSPNPLTYDTRSLERKSRKNNQNEEKNNWSRTLPSSSTRNKLLVDTKNNKVVEKNYLNQHHQATEMARNKKLDPILETSREAITDLSSMDNSKEVFTPKYDSGIEMEAHHLHYQSDKPPLARRNVNLIVQQLTEESRHREQLRKKYEEEGIDTAPRMPRLSIVEPDPTIGLSHNRNLPFSYTGGSPTRLSPLRSARTAQSPEGRSPPANEMKYSADPVVKDNRHHDTSTRALHVVLENSKGQSPERNLYRSVKGVNDKVPPHGKFFSSHPLQHEEDDVDSIKARFLFGDHHHESDDEDEKLYFRTHKPQLIEDPSSLSYPETIDDSENHYKPYKNDSRDLSYGTSRNNKQEKGTSYNYSNENSSYNMKLNERPVDFTTKVLPTNDREYHETRLFHYSDDEDYKNGPESYDYFVKKQDRRRSPSPEPVPKRNPHVRTIRLGSRSPDRLDSEPSERLATYNRQANRFMNQIESRRPYYEEDEPDDEPPIPPIRTKRRSQQNSPSRPIEIAKKSNNVDRDQNSRPTQSYPNKWNHSAEANGSLERSLYRKRETQGMQDADLARQKQDTKDNYRYPSPERERSRYYSEEVEKRSSSSHSGTAEPVKREKIQRQREKFLAAFLGIGKGRKNKNNDKKGARKSPTPVHVKQQEPYEDWQKEDYDRSLKRKSTRPNEVRGQTVVIKGEKHGTRKSPTPLYDPRDKPREDWEDHDYTRSLKRDEFRGQRENEVKGHLEKTEMRRDRKSTSPVREHGQRSYETWDSAEYTRSLKRDKVKGHPLSSDKQRGRRSPTPERELRQGSYEDWDNRDYSRSLKRDEVRGQRSSEVKKQTVALDIENHSRSKAEKYGTSTGGSYEDWDNRDYTRSLKRGEVRGQRVAEVKGRHLITINAENQTRRKNEKLGSRQSPVPGYQQGDGAWEDWEGPDYSGGLKRDEVNRDVTHKDARGQRGKEVKGQDQRARWESRTDHEVRVADRNTPNGRIDEKRFRPRKQESPERFDSSESDETRATRLRNARYKSQSHSNLYYRRDEEVRMDQEDHDENHNWNSATLNRLEQRSRRRDAVERQQRQVRPYASTQMLYHDSEERDGRNRYFGDTDRESQQSGAGRYSRYEARGRVGRTASNAVADVGAVKKGIMSRQVGSSHSQQQNHQINSSGSEAGSHADSGASQRSVYLHAATVADIPSVPSGTPTAARGARVQSREEPPVQSGDTLRQARHTSRSFSVLAPWKPRHYREKYEITYTNNQMPVTIVTDQNNAPANTVGKPPRAPRKRQDSIGDPVGNQRGTVYRSSTGPKRNGITGWFRRKKR